MLLTPHDLMQLDNGYLESLTPEALRNVSKKLLADLKEAVDRLNQNSNNSSV
ncbi:MAG: IS66 family transposase, partial [Magnetococcales bacterium]|nr:IS66 family transposase [Magnetococcales bacterium]